ncbi:Tail sheath protein [Oleispira antarctica RB-8]|uniref:Tail sheath protein n=1 Tax=Oleispira antarctica RB-8 TaxID=698738 RepID=R4YSF9_OLEAN|nr:Tail sheath protein [Oleispira antarctica RB-8]
MALGKVKLTQENTASGGISAVERRVLFIGTGDDAADRDVLHVLNAQSDLDVLLGAADSVLKTNIEAAMLNAGEDFTGYVFPLKAVAGLYTWDTALEFALETPNDVDVEIVALVDAITTDAEVDLLNAAAVSAYNTYGKFLSIHAAVPGIASETWSVYLAATKAINNTKVATRVALVPQLHGNNLGVVVGRLINSDQSIGDSPMRVRSGSVVGLGIAPVDSAGLPLTMAHLGELATNRFSVPQSYTNFDGIYWADHPMLDAEGGDFQVYENLRVIDFVSRRVRILMIQKVADRELNATDSSIAYHQTYFMRPVRSASKSTTIRGVTKPGLIKPPSSDDIVITWKSKTEVEIHMVVTPYESPKQISAKIALDLTSL